MHRDGGFMSECVQFTVAAPWLAGCAAMLDIIIIVVRVRSVQTAPWCRLLLPLLMLDMVVVVIVFINISAWLHFPLTLGACMILEL